MRVVAGRLRGRRLKALKGETTRPTSDRAREGLFAWLGPGVSGVKMLDLFAGTGSVGIEALSRGAKEVVFVERVRAAVGLLRCNLSSLELSGVARVLARDVRSALVQLCREGARFDLIFADPPYGRHWEAELARSQELRELLAPGGMLVVERSSGELPKQSVPAFELRSTKTFGGTAFDWYE